MPKQYIQMLLLILCVCTFSNCNRSTNQKMTTPEISAPILPASNLNIPIQISKSELEVWVNQLIKQNFASGITLEEGYKCNIKTVDNIQVQINSNKIITDLPLFLEIFPKSDYSGIKAEGEILIQISTAIDIFENQVISKTEVLNHRWLKSPKLNFLGIQIPMQGIANGIISRTKATLCKSIDQSIQKAFSLPKLETSLKKYFLSPLYSSEDQIIHLFGSPQEIGLGPFTMKDGQLVIPLIVYFESVISETRPAELDNNIGFTVRPTYETQSQLSIQSRIPLNYLDQLIREQVINQSYGSGISKITIHKIQLDGEGRKMLLHMNMTGAYNGQMDLSFSPVFSVVTQKIELLDLDLKAVSGRTIDKTKLALIRGIAERKVKDILQEQMNTLLTEYVLQIGNLMNAQEVYPGAVLNGNIVNYQLSQFQIHDKRIYFNIKANMLAGLQINKIQSGTIAK
ncbi:MAG: DUF4403 family protein [Bacteroidota bacterium]|nr:DUF4403 family protein [Bacteroidota bacterium]